MSKNIEQVYISNPITSNASTDLMYFGQSPYGAGDDAAMTYSNFSAQFGAPYTASALTKTNDTNVTLTLSGTPGTSLLQAVGITAGWTGTLSGTRGGTGVNNGASTITLGGSLTTSGAFASTFTMTNTTTVTFPTSGILATTSQLPTPAALTEVNDTNVTLTLGGTPATALLQATSITAGWAGQLSLARGGTNANLTASAGSVAYSSSTAIALSAVGSSGQLFQSTGTTAPGWTTNTYPTTDAKGDILYASASNVIAGLTIGSTGNVLTVSGGLPAWAAISTIGSINSINGDSGSVTPTSGAVTISGGTTGLTTSGSSSTLNLTGALKLANGGTNASLTPSNGGIFYSNATAGAILAGTATANQVLLSGSTTTPSWSTATYPTTTTINQLLYSSSANTISGLATGNNGALITSSGGVPSISSTLPSAVQTNITALGTQIQALNMGTNAINNVTDPVNAQDAATKNYVDNIATGGAAACVAASTASLTVTYNNGVSGVGATLTNAGAQATFALDGQSPTVGQRVLIKNQSSTFQNGIYLVTSVGSGITNWILTRAIDYDTVSDINDTGVIPVTAGTVNSNTGWVNTTTMVTVGTTAITYVQFGASYPISLANGGTNAALTASAGSITYSTGSALALSAVGSSGQLFTSAGTSAPGWTTSTYPSTNAANTLLYASSANTMAALATANSSSLATTSAGVPTWLGPLTNGQIIIGSTSATPVAATITAGTNINVTNAAGSITIAATGPGSFSWVDQTSGSVTMAINTGYVTDNGASLVTYTLPTTAALGSEIKIIGFSSGGWKIAQQASQLIHVGNQTTTTGTGGSLASSNTFDCVDIICVVANTTWVVKSMQSSGLTYV